FGLNLCLILAVLLSSCNMPLETEEGGNEPPPLEEATASPQPQAEHRIGVRQVGGVGEFYDKTTGARFIPRGANYVFVPAGGGNTNLLLRVNTYDPERTRDDFARLAGLGYNTVRDFLDQCSRGAGCIANVDSAGLNP